jgi:hypothetical protein
MTWAWAWAWACAFARTFAFACHVHAQSKHFQGTNCGACSLAAAPLGGQCCTLSRVESPGMTCTAGTKLVSRKQHNKLTAFVARVWTAQWRQPVLSVCSWGTPFSGCRGCRGFIAENLRHCIQRCYCWSSRGALHHRQKQQGPTSTTTCYVVSLSQARGG